MTEYVDAVTAVMLEKDPEMLQEANKRRIANATGGSVCVFAHVAIPSYNLQAQPSANATPVPTPEVCSSVFYAPQIMSLKVKRKDAKPDKHEKPPPSVISADHGHGKKLWPFKK